MKSLQVVVGVAALWFVGMTPAMAQGFQYTCRAESGREFTQSRPCPMNSSTTAVMLEQGSRGDSQPMPSIGYGRNSAVAPGEPEYFQYMSPRCRSLQENLRSSRAHRLSQETMAGMRNEYNRDCKDEETAASSRYYREQRDASAQRRLHEREELREREGARQEDAKKAQQCAEARRILAVKKARTDLTPGELNDLRRFELNTAERCAPR